MSKINKSIVASKDWDIKERVLMHALLHQFVLGLMELRPNLPILNEYKAASFEAVSGFLWGDPIADCLNNIALADEVFNALQGAIDDILTKEMYENPIKSFSDTGFITCTHMVMTPYFLEEYFETVSENEINEYFDDIDIDEDGQSCSSAKLQELMVSLGNQRFDRLDSFLEDNPVVSWDVESFSDNYAKEESYENLQIPPSLYKIVNHEMVFKEILLIMNDKGFYAPSKNPVISSFDPKPPIGFEPSDPSTYYRNQIEYMFKSMDYNTKGDIGDFSAIELGIKTWIRKSISSFLEGDYTKALYIVSAAFCEFTRGLSLDILSEELEWNYDFQDSMGKYLDDALALTLFYMDYVDDTVYNKVYPYLQQLVESQKEMENSPLDTLDIGLDRVTTYYDLRTKRNKARL